MKTSKYEILWSEMASVTITAADTTTCTQPNVAEGERKNTLLNGVCARVCASQPWGAPELVLQLWLCFLVGSQRKKASLGKGGDLGAARQPGWEPTWLTRHETHTHRRTRAQRLGSRGAGMKCELQSISGVCVCVFFCCVCV